MYIVSVFYYLVRVVVINLVLVTISFAEENVAAFVVLGMSTEMASL